MVRFITDSREKPANKAAPLLLIGAGVPRAATSSMQAAFELLGFTPCLHMAEIIPHASREQLLLDAVTEKNTERRQKLLHELIDGHVSVCDLPAVFFAADLMDMYPDVKLVLNGRPSPEVWARSARASLGFFFTPWFKWTGMLWKTDRLWYSLNMECIKWCKATLGVDDIFTAQGYETYYEYVRSEARNRGKEILEFKAEDGWEPLCKFLEKNVPEKPFPRMNEKKIFTIIKSIIIVRGLFAWVGLGVACWGAWKLGMRFFKELATAGV
ncbi:hypothetical protein AK830_g4341 [Neonectria ditissima]|uniref:Uncharacterized protein n=1 Tax=Neonectria ditissima TaxID=78410 RepID=A0A0P7BN91_9HYPO|nr:hypothetical protein AK830_g4341 [Neonectria ditissima]